MSDEHRTKSELIAELRESRAKQEQLESQVRERMKELNCLYGLSELTDRQDVSLEEILAGTADILPPSWQFPEIACARVVLDGREFSTGNFEATRWRQSADIQVKGKKAGAIEVFYREARPESDEGPFLTAERTLLDAMAERLGRIVERRQAIDDTRHDKEMLKVAMMGLNAHVFAQDLDLRFTRVFNPAVGFDPETLIGKTDADFLPPNQAAPITEFKRRALEAGVNDRAEFRLQTGEDERVFEVTLEPQRNVSGDLDGIVGVSRDITDREQAAEKSRRQKKFLENVLESIETPFFVLDANDYTIKMANSAAKQFGELAEDTKCYELTRGKKTPCQGEDRQCPLSQVKATGKTASAIHLYPTADGSSKYYNVRGYPVFNKEGEVAQIIEYMTDITERRHSEQALRESEELNRALVDTSPDAITLSDLEGRILKHNPQTLALHGFEHPDELLGKNAFDLIASEDRGRAIDNAKKTAEAGSIRGVEYSMLRNDGSSFVGELSASLVMDSEGKPMAFMAVTRDITKRRQAEEEIHKLNQDLDRRVRERTTELAASNRELESFAYSVSHDLRAPLRAIDGFSQALLEEYSGSLDSQGRNYLDRVSAAARRMAQLIDDLLKLSRVTRAGMRRERVELSVVAREIVGQLQEAYPERGATFVINDDLEAWGDPLLLRLALENMLDNAFKFTGKHPQARIEFGALEQEDQTAYFVRDDGVGFDMAYADKLFAPFQRLHSRAEFPGTGIGLATVQRIVHRHGGRVWAEGQVDRGATFYFTLLHRKEKR